MSTATDKQESRFKDYILPVFGMVILIIGYFVSTEKEKNDANIKDLYTKWDSERDHKISNLGIEVQYYRNKYYNCRDAKH